MNPLACTVVNFLLCLLDFCFALNSGFRNKYVLAWHYFFFLSFFKPRWVAVAAAAPFAILATVLAPSLVTLPVVRVACCFADKPFVLYSTFTFEPLTGDDVPPPARFGAVVSIFAREPCEKVFV